MILAKAILTLIASVFLCLPASPSSAQTPQRNRELKREQTQSAKRRLALVIGNGEYTNASPLKNPPNDARDMAATLKELDFDVASGMNLNQREMKNLIRTFGQKLKEGGDGLFYYAGHGVQSKGRNYLIPVEADIQSEAEVEDAGVDLNLVLGYMDDAQNNLNIVILDACRNNPFSRGFRSASSGLAQVDAPTGTLIAYATAPGRVASDGAGQNGLYTSELLKKMRIPGLSVTEMFMRVRGEVMKQTASKQVPWEASSLVGTFYFSGPGNAETSSGTSAKSATDPAAFELSFWETIKNSTNPEDFRAYLKAFPNGRFAELARTRSNSAPSGTKPASAGSTPASGLVRIPAQTDMLIELLTPLYTEPGSKGVRISARVLEGKDKVYEGATLFGLVSPAPGASNDSNGSPQKGELTLSFERIHLTDGREADFKATVEDVVTGKNGISPTKKEIFFYPGQQLIIVTTKEIIIQP
jgi:hypothetical protein